jgi:molybdopterin/thiamine biosynthesis adenylyltransferase
MDKIHSPLVFFQGSDSTEYRNLISDESVIKRDYRKMMLVELALNKNPSIDKNNEREIEKVLEGLIDEKPSRLKGNNIYYPWKKELITILDEEDFVFLRTCRNRNKISIREQEILSSKTIGIVGLSVGFSVLMAIALERIAGRIKIADFDSLELSNLNRIYQPLSNLNLNKAIAAARSVSEIDPYIQVEVFEEGIIFDENMDEFFGSNTGDKIDCIIDECDSGEVKLELRKKARELGIPLIMETSDRSVLDIERYDLERNYPLLHGMLETFSQTNQYSDELKREILMSSIDFTKVSERGLSSMSEIGKSIRTWPQLGTDVLCGGASAAIAVKKILLGEQISSKRIYLDLESSIH